MYLAWLPLESCLSRLSLFSNREQAPQKKCSKRDEAPPSFTRFVFFPIPQFPHCFFFFHQKKFRLLFKFREKKKKNGLKYMALCYYEVVENSLPPSDNTNESNLCLREAFNALAFFLSSFWSTTKNEDEKSRYFVTVSFCFWSKLMDSLCFE